jgi:alkaline phosphatase
VKTLILFKMLGITLVLLLIIQGYTLHVTASTSDAEGPPAIILFIGDGMCAAQRTAGCLVSAGSGGKLAMDRLPISGWSVTDTASGKLTDSAAAATAMATGVKTWRGWLSIGDDKESLPTILEHAQDRGWAVGLTHATPAAFAAHVFSRNSTTEIALQLLERQVNVLLAGGENGFLPENQTGCYPGPANAWMAAI